MSAYRQPVERYWWARRRSYLRFMLREISCIFVAWFVLYLVLVLRAVGAGGNSYQRFLDFSANPVVVVLNVVALSFLLLHAVTWFGSAPRAMVIQVRGRRVTRSRGPCWALRGMAGGFGDRCLDGAVMTPSTSDARSRRRSAEPFLWLLFSAGGMVTALVAPVLLLLFGLAFRLGWLDAPDHGHLLAMVRNPITKLVVLVLVVLALFHAAHRFRFVLDHGLQLGRFDRVIALWCYGMAVLGSATAGWMLLTM